MVEILEKYEKSRIKFEEYIEKELGIFESEVDKYNIINFLDTQQFYIGIYIGYNGLDWIVDVCSIPVGIAKNRYDAELIGIEAALESLENYLNTKENEN